MSALDLLDSKDVGERLRIARERVNLTQKDVSDSLGIARTTLVAIEKGERKIRFTELMGLAKIYGSTANSLLRSESVQIEIEPQFRKLQNSESVGVNSAAKLLSDLVKAEIELENLLGVQRVFSFPPERPILKGDVRAQAEQDAFELRQRLGLGGSPVLDIVTLFEMELGVRLYIRPLDSSISGLFAFNEKIGPCILLNAKHPKERRSQTAAHECGHFISTRNQPEVLFESEKESSREERYANAFARAFLTPDRTVRQKFLEVTAGSVKLTRRHIIVLAHFFSVSRQAIVLRLEELKLVPEGSWSWFEDKGGITEDQVQQVLGDLIIRDRSPEEGNRPTTLRLNLLAAEAFKKELLSEGQLARLLCVDRVELRKILDNLEVEGSEADDAPKLLD